MILLSSKPKSYIALLAILVCVLRAEATTVIFIVTPQGIVAGADQLVTEIGLSPTIAPEERTGTKVLILKNRFIVASVGSQNVQWSQNGTTKVLYDFIPWVRAIEPNLAADVSVSSLASIIENEASATFKRIGIDEKIKAGAIPHTRATDKDFINYLIAGYDSGIPYLYHIGFNFDWCNNRLAEPMVETLLPDKASRVDFGFQMYGVTNAIKDFSNPKSYAYERLMTQEPVAFKKLLSLNSLTTKEAESIVKVLIRTQAKVNPSDVGSESIVLSLPNGITGQGTHKGSQRSLSQKAGTTKNKPKKSE